MVEEAQPDVVMTDIKMPYMDGMELAGHIRADFPATKILLFTGFDEFEYAKEAVHIGGRGIYIKACEFSGAYGGIYKTKEKTGQEIGEKRNAESLRKYYLDSFLFCRQIFIPH